MIEIEDEEFNTELLIQYSLLQKILIKLAKAQNDNKDIFVTYQKNLKSKDKKIEELEKRLDFIQNNNEKRFKEIDEYLKKLTDKIKNPEKTSNEDLNFNMTVVDNTLPKQENETNKTDEEEEEEEIIVKKPKKKKKKKIIEVSESEEEEEEKKESIEKPENLPDAIKINEKKNQERKSEKKVTYNDNKTEKSKEEDDEENKDLIRSDKKKLTNRTSRTERTEDDEQFFEEQQKILKLTTKSEISKMRERLVVISDNPEIPKDHTSPELLAMLFKRMKIAEKKLEAIEMDIENSYPIHKTLQKGINRNVDKIADNKKEIDKLKKDLTKLTYKVDRDKKDLDDIKVKVEDFNVYDLFKDSGNGNMDATKVLVRTLEAKCNKRFEIQENRQKTNDEDIFKLKNDMTNVNNLGDMLTKQNENNKEIINTLTNDLNETKETQKDNFNTLNKKIDSLENINVSDNNSKGADMSLVKKEIENSETKIMHNVNTLLDSIKLDALKNSNPKISQEDLDLIKQIQKKLTDLEKEMRLGFSNITFDDVNNKIQLLANELKTKITKFDLEDLYDKQNEIKEYAKDIAYKGDTNQENIEKFKSEMALITRKIEFLTGQYSALSFNQIGNKDKSSKLPAIDFSRFVDTMRFNETNKILNQKIEHCKYLCEENQKILDDLLYKLQHSPTDEDFAQYQSTVKSMLEELKLYCSKRFSDKIDVSKNVRYLDTQIKNVMDIISKRNEGGDTWLLAKKPIHNYQCASCEAYLNELKPNSDYIPWNKIPKHDEKNYRMGHGFSRMLQLVNNDLLKSVEMTREPNKGYLSDEEKIMNSNNKNNLNNTSTTGIKETVKLPKVMKRRMKSNINTENGAKTESNAPFNGNNNSSTLSPYENPVNTEDEPKIMKIYKKK